MNYQINSNLSIPEELKILKEKNEEFKIQKEIWLTEKVSLEQVLTDLRSGTYVDKGEHVEKSMII